MWCRCYAITKQVAKIFKKKPLAGTFNVVKSLKIKKIKKEVIWKQKEENRKIIIEKRFITRFIAFSIFLHEWCVYYFCHSSIDDNTHSHRTHKRKLISEKFHSFRLSVFKQAKRKKEKGCKKWLRVISFSF